MAWNLRRCSFFGEASITAAAPSDARKVASGEWRVASKKKAFALTRQSFFAIRLFPSEQIPFWFFDRIVVQQTARAVFRVLLKSLRKEIEQILSCFAALAPLQCWKKRKQQLYGFER